MTLTCVDCGWPEGPHAKWCPWAKKHGNRCSVEGCIRPFDHNGACEKPDVHALRAEVAALRVDASQLREELLRHADCCTRLERELAQARAQFLRVCRQKDERAVQARELLADCATYIEVVSGKRPPILLDQVRALLDPRRDDKPMDDGGACHALANHPLVAVACDEARRCTCPIPEGYHLPNCDEARGAPECHCPLTNENGEALWHYHRHDCEWAKGRLEGK